MDQWHKYRHIIEHWERTISVVAKADLSPGDFDELERAVLYGSAMGHQILDALAGYPKTFHLAMLPDLKANFQERMEETKEEMEKANNALIRQTNSGGNGS